MCEMNECVTRFNTIDTNTHILWHCTLRRHTKERTNRCRATTTQIHTFCIGIFSTLSRRTMMMNIIIMTLFDTYVVYFLRLSAAIHTSSFDDVVNFKIKFFLNKSHRHIQSAYYCNCVCLAFFLSPSRHRHRQRTMITFIIRRKTEFAEREWILVNGEETEP